jgi:hypothetical protein
MPSQHNALMTWPYSNKIRKAKNGFFGSRCSDPEHDFFGSAVRILRKPHILTADGIPGHSVPFPLESLFVFMRPVQVGPGSNNYQRSARDLGVRANSFAQLVSVHVGLYLLRPITTPCPRPFFGAFSVVLLRRA